MKGPIILKVKKLGKNSNIFSRNAECWLSAVIAAVIMVFAYAVWKFFPFGENIILRMDLYHQYAPLYGEFIERVFGGDSLLYSFTSGLGSGFLGNYFNYLSSPTLFIVLLFGHFNLPEAIATVVLVKASASAYTFTYFLGKITKKSDVSTAAFGLMYAFCGYFVAYYWNIMWLDAMVAFPLVMLGVWYIINKHKPVMYVVSLAYVMMTNYYMAYMTCFLSVIFFLYFYFSEHTMGEKLCSKDYIIKPKYKKTLGCNFFNSRFLTTGFTFAGSSILAALIACFSLLPVIFILQGSSATNSNFPSSFSTYFNVFDFLANHLAGLDPTIRSSGEPVLPNVYCGIISLVLLPVYMFSKKFTVKEKIATTAVIGVFFLSFNINMLNYIWHGFHFPNDLPYRFSFAYSFFLLYIAYKVVASIDKVSGKDILISSCFVAAFAMFVEKIGSKNVDQTVVWTSIAFAIIYAVILVFLKNPKYAKASISILLLTAVCAEILIADTPNYKVTQTKDAYTSSYEDTEAAIDIIEDLEGEDGFYRMELASLLTRMDNSWFYYPGVSTFTSMAYEKVANLQYCLGLYGNEINSYTYNCQTGLYNSMMSLKYIVDNHSYVPTDNYKPVMDGNFLYTKVDSYNDMTIYKNNYWLPVAFSVNEGTDSKWVYNNGDESRNDINPFVSQNDFWYNASGVADILTKIDGVVSDTRNIESIDDASVKAGKFSVYKEKTSEKSNEVTFKYEIKDTQNVYVYVCANEVDSVLVSCDGFTYNQSIDSDPYVLDVGNVKAGSDLYISYSIKDDKNSSNVNQYVYGMDQNKFIKAYNTIVDNGILDVTENRESYIKGTVNLASGKMLYTSIPYDKGWTVLVDGVKVAEEDIVKIGDALMGVYMDSGEHTVEFKFTPRGLVLGLGLTASGILVLVLLLILKKKEKLFFGPSFRADYVELGKWRDLGAEAERDEAIALEQAQLDEIVEYELSQQSQEEENDSPWAAAMAAAESFARTSAPEEEAEPEVQDTEESETEENVSETPVLFDSVEKDGSEMSDFSESSLDNMLDEFEKATDNMENHQHSKLSAEEKKTAQKKRLNLTIFIIISIVAVIASAAIMIYAAKNPANKPAEETTTVPSLPVFESESETKEEESSEELTTISTTKPVETTTEKPETTTQKPVTTTVAPSTTKPVTTTKAPVTEYQGEYVTYTLKYGDTYYSILRDHGISPNPQKVQKFCEINGINTWTTLKPGTVLKVPLDF